MNKDIKRIRNEGQKGGRSFDRISVKAQGIKNKTGLGQVRSGQVLDGCVVDALPSRTIGQRAARSRTSTALRKPSHCSLYCLYNFQRVSLTACSHARGRPGSKMHLRTISVSVQWNGNKRERVFLFFFEMERNWSGSLIYCYLGFIQVSASVVVFFFSSMWGRLTGCRWRVEEITLVCRWSGENQCPADDVRRETGEEASKQEIVSNKIKLYDESRGMMMTPVSKHLQKSSNVVRAWVQGQCKAVFSLN